MVHTVAIAGYDGILGYELGFFTEVFGLDRSKLGADYRLRVCPVESGNLRTSHGHTLRTDATSGELVDADTVIVPGWRNIEQPAPRRLIDLLQAAHANGARVVGICSGAFPVADAGLLDNQIVTTHWLYADKFRARHPNIRLDPEPLYILGTNNTATSAGSSAGLDLCLALVAADYGVEAATSIANRMVVTHHRPGSQNQFVPCGWRMAATDTGRLDHLLDWIDQHLDDPLTIDDLAARAHTSRRTLIRHFTQVVGTSPHTWITQRRLSQARHLLETTTLTIEAIARKTGLGTPANLRSHLIKSTGHNPTTYRRLYAQG